MTEMIKAVCKGEIFGGLADCYVLADGRRVLSQRGAVRVLTAKDDGKTVGAGGGEISRYFSRLPPKYSKDLVMPGIQFSRPGGGIATGIEATLFVKALRAYVAAHFDSVLHKSQEPFARNAARILSALSEVGIVALVDEATGYQVQRAHDDLARLFGRALRDDPAEYGILWHSRLIREMCRLYGKLYREGDLSLGRTKEIITVRLDTGELVCRRAMQAFELQEEMQLS